MLAASGGTPVSSPRYGVALKLALLQRYHLQPGHLDNALNTSTDYWPSQALALQPDSEQFRRHFDHSFGFARSGVPYLAPCLIASNRHFHRSPG